MRRFRNLLVGVLTALLLLQTTSGVADAGRREPVPLSFPDDPGEPLP